MKVEVGLLKEELLGQYPKPLRSMRDYNLHIITSMMSIYGIASISIQLDWVGIKPIQRTTFNKLVLDENESVPAGLEEYRTEVVRMLVELMLMVGVVKVAIKPTTEDKQKLLKFWEDLRTGKTITITPVEKDTDPSFEVVEESP
jgi:hypothetical protein